jgi:hypothetical protein
MSERKVAGRAGKRSKFDLEGVTLETLVHRNMKKVKLKSYGGVSAKLQHHSN